MGLSQLVDWLLVTALFITLSLLAAPESVAGRWLIKRLTPVGVWVVSQIRPEPAFDQAADEWFKLLRREQLRVDLRRLSLLIASDMHMSATRQLGNRLAYESVRHDLQATRFLVPLAAGDIAADWSSAPGPTSTAEWSSSYSRRGSSVETLEISWRS